MENRVCFEFAHPLELRFVYRDNRIVRTVKQWVLDGGARQIPGEDGKGAGWNPKVLLKTIPLRAELHS
jgi:hypothetical protein